MQQARQQTPSVPSYNAGAYRFKQTCCAPRVPACPVPDTLNDSTKDGDIGTGHSLVCQAHGLLGCPCTGGKMLEHILEHASIQHPCAEPAQAEGLPRQ